MIGKCQVAPIRHQPIPKLELQAAVYRVHLIRQILREHELKTYKNYRWIDLSTVLQWLPSAHQETAHVPYKQSSRNNEKFLHESTETFQRHWKPCRYWHKKDVHRMSQGLRVVKQAAWLQTGDEWWPKPCW